MTEITGRATGIPPGPAATPRPNRPTQPVATVHESYAFACLGCGHGWEQSYDIEHHIDGAGREFVMYIVNGERVPSPIARPTCMNCGGHTVRIMQAGRVSSVLDILHRHQEAPKVPKPGTESGEATSGGEATSEESGHHWHLSDLLHPFQHRKAG
ncbi:hypothetical protein [Streptomyces apocyni]|uniref:hypothetical protein n=1 Tax=Streptomyces apocyni TaxID=2654677 RepID=UPI001E41655E|nr:hypothetical protein [Streptomyces apocyni]